MSGYAEGPPTQQTHGWQSSVGGFLGDALAAWGQVEKVKAIRNSAGAQQADKKNTVELDNGAAVVVDAPKATANATSNETMIFGVPQKTVLMGFGGLLVLGVVLKVMK
ncbi:hypothetical protein [Pseudoalteromonas aurantia]|uniref:Uncharacterized protein n=1 Tax=Pseudoalteromonas aurantia 208 TaxID=1314867 RepID=A0ABR9EEM9_9GAMM|nr:hypothetical protein [Pseudoalteromonas aurantia]MBE0369227.1 hypothetical protein [Pseudoalteromonas aurantia 208]